jgi:hypothetical protein
MEQVLYFLFSAACAFIGAVGGIYLFEYAVNKGWLR